MVRRSRDPVLSLLVCRQCQTPFPIMRRLSRRRPVGHIKDLWCWRCQAVTPHIELSPWDTPPSGPSASPVKTPPEAPQGPALQAGLTRPAKDREDLSDETKPPRR